MCFASQQLMSLLMYPMVSTHICLRLFYLHIFLISFCFYPNTRYKCLLTLRSVSFPIHSTNALSSWFFIVQPKSKFLLLIFSWLAKPKNVADKNSNGCQMQLKNALHHISVLILKRHFSHKSVFISIQFVLLVVRFTSSNLCVGKWQRWGFLQ